MQQDFIHLNYAAKADLRNAIGIHTSKLVAKFNLVVDKLDIEKLVPVPVDLSKLSGVVKKNAYDKLVAKVNNIDTSGFVLKTKHDKDKSEL